MSKFKKATEVRRDNVRKYLPVDACRVYDVLCRCQPYRVGTAGIYPHLNADQPYIYLKLDGDAKLVKILEDKLNADVRLHDGWLDAIVIAEQSE